MGQVCKPTTSNNTPAKVPLNGEISFPELAAKCELYEPDLHRILRFAMVYHRVFRERNVGYVAHTAASRRLVENAHAMDALGSQFDEVWQAFAHVRNERIRRSSILPHLRYLTLMPGGPMRQWEILKAMNLPKQSVHLWISD